MALVGIYGYGRSHLDHLSRLAATDRVEVVGLCDPQAPDDVTRRLAPGARHSADLETLLSATEPDITIISTPLHTHRELAELALAAGSHLLLEKPPTATLADFERLQAAVAHHDRVVQVGFQSFGSHGLDEIEARLRAGTIGQVVGIGAAGAWIRTAAYYQRSRWAGRRALDGVPVVDGALTNPFAHATATALRIDGSDQRGQLTDVRLELYRANPIEADDTSSLRVTTTAGTTIVVAVTLCADRNTQPFIVIEGTEGEIRFEYKTHLVELERDGHIERSVHPETNLLEDLLDHLEGRRPEPRSPLARCGAFTEVVEAVRLAPAPTPIAERFVDEVVDDGATRRIVPGIDEAVRTAAQKRTTFAEQGLPWATRPPTPTIGTKAAQETDT